VRKRHHILIDAFAGVRERHRDAKLVIVGKETFETSYPERLRRKVASLGLNGAVEVVGNVAPSEVARYLNASDVFSLASQREGCCNSVLEALACGTPVVTTPVGDNQTFVEDGVNGYIVPVDDPDRLMSAILLSLDDCRWNKSEISKRLTVGDWDSVALKVANFFRNRLDA
jgi:glycosyltransferase involved in cell wall biosynthesis